MTEVIGKRLNGYLCLVNNSGELVATSFKQWCMKENLQNKIAAEKRIIIENLLNKGGCERLFMANGSKYYVTKEGGEFLLTCKQTTTSYRDKKVIPLAPVKVNVPISPPKQNVDKPRSVEQLATEENDHSALNEQSDLYADMFVRMGAETECPFLLNRCHENPYGSHKPVVLTLYQELTKKDDVVLKQDEVLHKGFVVLGGKGTLHAVKAQVLDSGRYAAMRKSYGDNMLLYVVANTFTEEAKQFIELTLHKAACCTVDNLVGILYKKALKYYTKVHLVHKLWRWYDLYPEYVDNFKPAPPHKQIKD